MDIKSQLDRLKNQDIYSLILFTLYKFTNIPEYSTLSELAYILDKDNLLNLCKYFGGITIRIPTAKELEILVYTLLLFEYVEIEKMDYEKAVSIITNKTPFIHDVKINYSRILPILKNYKFGD